VGACFRGQVGAQLFDLGSVAEAVEDDVRALRGERSRDPQTDAALSSRSPAQFFLAACGTP
jgi:hypothetical protein